MYKLFDKYLGGILNQLCITTKPFSGLPIEKSHHVGESKSSIVDVNQCITEETNNNSNKRKLTEISELAHCRSLELPKTMKATKISRLTYTNKGDGILILATNAVHLLWKWQCNELNSNGKATTSVSPQLQRGKNGALMINDARCHDPEESIACCALSKNDAYVVSASGGKISLYNMITFKKMVDCMPPPPKATFLALYPEDNNIIAIGMDNSTILIYNKDEVIKKLEGHTKRITGLAFSSTLNILVSAAAEGQVCVWSSVQWDKQRARYLQFPPGKTPAAQSDTWVQFHHNQTHFLVAHETQLAIYETKELKCLKQWLPYESSSLISHATFSCDGELIYASFLDATVCVFNTSHLHMCCRINPSAYLSPSVSSNMNVHPLVVAGHPTEANQFALGLSDGRVYVLEPLESEGKWGVPLLSEIKRSRSDKGKGKHTWQRNKGSEGDIDPEEEENQVQRQRKKPRIS